MEAARSKMGRWPARSPRSCLAFIPRRRKAGLWRGSMPEALGSALDPPVALDSGAQGPFGESKEDSAWRTRGRDGSVGGSRSKSSIFDRLA
jgi:hypothetical protein